MSPQTLAEVDRWAKAQADKPDRSEALRRLVDAGLSRTAPAAPISPKTAARASKLAAQEIDRVGDASASSQERESRKRRLLKGPGEFRDLRRDHPGKK
jgi:hypothetical protein